MKTFSLTEAQYDYVAKHAPLPHPQLTQLIDETRRLPGANMQISPDQGALMNFLARLIGARRCIEVGCFTGFSAISVAAALPADGKLISLDINPDTAAIARRHATAAGLDKLIDIRLGPATTSFDQLITEFGPASFDMAFIDADKANYDTYYERSLQLLRTGGLLIVDNVLWGGHVIDAQDQTLETQAIRSLNDKIAHDERVDRVMLHIADGLYLARKR